MMADIENILNDDEFFADAADTWKEGVVQIRTQECLKVAIKEGRVRGSKNQCDRGKGW